MRLARSQRHPSKHTILVMQQLLFKLAPSPTVPQTDCVGLDTLKPTIPKEFSLFNGYPTFEKPPWPRSCSPVNLRYMNVERRLW